MSDDHRPQTSHDKAIVRGSSGGGPTDPHWVHNIRKNPDTVVRTGFTSWRCTARVSTGAERERLFEILDAVSPSTSMYQNMCAPRELALVVFEEI